MTDGVVVVFCVFELLSQLFPKSNVLLKHKYSEITIPIIVIDQDKKGYF